MSLTSRELTALALPEPSQGATELRRGTAGGSRLALLAGTAVLVDPVADGSQVAARLPLDDDGLVVVNQQGRGPGAGAHPAHGFLVGVTEVPVPLVAKRAGERPESSTSAAHRLGTRPDPQQGQRAPWAAGGGPWRRLPLLELANSPGPSGVDAVVLGSRPVTWSKSPTKKTSGTPSCCGQSMGTMRSSTTTTFDGKGSRGEGTNGLSMRTSSGADRRRLRSTERAIRREALTAACSRRPALPPTPTARRRAAGPSRADPPG